MEFTIDNCIAKYFYSEFNMNIQVSETIITTFGLMNWFLRAMNRVMSEVMGRRFEMRGRHGVYRWSRQ